MRIFYLFGCNAFLIGAVGLLACGQIESDRTRINNDAELSKMDEPSKALTILNVGDLQYLDKLLLQRSRSTQVHQQRAADFLQASLEMAAEDKASNFEKGYEGIVKMHCPPAMIYPTNESLIVCAESEMISDLQSTSRANRFRMPSRIYHSVLAFSEAVDEPLSAEQKEAVEANISCLDAFLANAVTPAPTCELVFTTLR